LREECAQKYFHKAYSELEEEQHKDDIWQWTSVQSRHLAFIISTNLCHNYLP
jgi:hypothetical protein